MTPFTPPCFVAPVPVAPAGAVTRIGAARRPGHALRLRCTAAPLPPPGTPLPHHRRPPPLGLIIDFLRGHNNPDGLAEQYGPLFYSDSLGKHVLRVADVDLINEAVRDPALSSKAAAFPKFFEELMTPNATTFMDGEQLRSWRAALSPAFVPALLPRHAAIARSSMRQSLADLQPGTDLAPVITRYVVRIALQSFCFTRPPTTVRSDGDAYAELCDFFMVYHRGFGVPQFMPAFRQALVARDWLIERFCALLAERLDVDADLIAEIRAEAADSKNSSKNLSRMIRAGRIDILTVLLVINIEKGVVKPDARGFEDLAAVAHSVLSLWTAATTTQITANICCFKELGSDPELLARVRAEVDGVVARRETDDTVDQSDHPDIDDDGTIVRPGDAPALDGLIMEAVRLRNPVFVLPRIAKEDTKIGGHAVLTGTRVMLDTTAAMLDPKRFPRPREIDVDRYVRDEAAKTAASLAFGSIGSPHYCMGAAVAKTALVAGLSVLVHEFDFSLVPRTTVEYTMIPEPRPRDGCVLESISPRKC